MLAQNCIKSNPLIILGSGASAGYGIPGMWPLGAHLSGLALPAGIPKAEQEAWEKFLVELPKTNLEQALTDVPLSSTLTKLIIESTWEFLNREDLRIFLQVCADRKFLALSKLYQHLFSSTSREIHVVTPNYDRLAEYAANAAGFSVYTGFNYGHLAHRASSPSPKIHEGKILVRTVSVWKVHGCFGWFADMDGVVTGLPPMEKIPAGMEPVIITPGIEKYRRTHDEPFRTIMHCADKCIQNASAYFCVGFGFNDQHLQTLLIERCQSEDVPLVLITQKISDTAKSFFDNKKVRRYLALEQDGADTKMYSTEYPAGVIIPGTSIWKLDEFLAVVI
jgi:hypothetical protein